MHATQAARPMRSMLAFASPELEALFQAYDAATLNFLAGLTPLLSLTLYFVLLTQMYGKGAPYRNLLPSLGLPFLFHLLPNAVVLILLGLQRGFYRKHRRAINFAIGGAFMLAFHAGRQAYLWLRFANPGLHDSLHATLQGFISENVYLAIMWLHLLSLPAGRLGDILISVGLLACAVGGNAAICASPLWPAQSVTMSPGTIAVAKNAAEVLFSAVFPMFRVSSESVMTCPAALAFWQVVGSWVALTAATLRELVCRTAFLRTNDARAWIVSEIGPSSTECPFSSYMFADKVVPALFLLTLAHVAGLALVLSQSSV